LEHNLAEKRGPRFAEKKKRDAAAKRSKTTSINSKKEKQGRDRERGIKKKQISSRNQGKWTVHSY